MRHPHDVSAQLRFGATGPEARISSFPGGNAPRTSFLQIIGRRHPAEVAPASIGSRSNRCAPANVCRLCADRGRARAASHRTGVEFTTSFRTERELKFPQAQPAN
jgi:hypothetical protein